MRATQWTAPTGRDHAEQRDRPCERTAQALPVVHVGGDPYQDLGIDITASGLSPRSTHPRGDRARRHESARQAGAEDISAVALTNRTLKPAVIGPFGANGVDIEQQCGLSAGNGGEQDAFAQRSVVAVDRAREVDAPLVVGPSPVRTPCMTQPSATTASSGVAVDLRSRGTWPSSSNPKRAGSGSKRQSLPHSQ